MANLGMGPSTGLTMNSRFYRFSASFVERWTGRLQNRFLAGTALTLSTIIGCVVGGMIAPFFTRWIIDRLDKSFKDDWNGSFTHRFCIAGVILGFFGLPVAIINYKMLTIFQLPLSRKFSMTLTVLPSTACALCVAYFHNEDPSEEE